MLEHPVAGEGTNFRQQLHLPALFLPPKLLQKLRQVIESLLRIRSDGLQNDPSAAVQIRTQHLENTCGGEAVVAFANEHFAGKGLHSADKLRRRPGVQAQFIHDFDFSPHEMITINDACPPARCGAKNAHDLSGPLPDYADIQF